MRVLSVDRFQGDEVYFTVERNDGVVGKIQLNMSIVIQDSYARFITWLED